MKEVVILDGARTAFGKFGGSLASVDAKELAVYASRGALAKANIAASSVDHLIVGNVMQTAPYSAYLARHIALESGMSIDSGAFTVSRACGSGLEAIIQACRLIQLDEADCVLAGGTENMSQAPHMLRNHRFGMKTGTHSMADMLDEALFDRYCNLVMAETAEEIALGYRISREEADEFALRSQLLAKQAQERGRFAKEIVPVKVKDRRGNVSEFAQDEHLRNTSKESLAQLKPLYRPDGIVTAGNASGLNDGAAMVIVASKEWAARRGLSGKTRIVSYAVMGVEPRTMGIGPVYSSLKALQRADLKVEDIQLWEINEAFAAQYIGVERGLELDRNLVNPNGGAIALGHPVGASGGRLALTLMYELEERQLRYGLASLCIGGGQGISLILERILN